MHARFHSHSSAVSPWQTLGSASARKPNAFISSAVRAKTYGPAALPASGTCPP